MNLWKIAWRNIQHRSLASGLTAFSMALGVALVVAVLVIHGVIDKSFRRGAQGYDLIVGADGSELQLVLAAAYYLDPPEKTIPYEYFEELSFGKYSAEVDLAIPICMGGNYQGYPVVGTSVDMFDKLQYAQGTGYEFQRDGRNFKAGSFFEAVIGADIAKKTGLRPGDEFQPVHGMNPDGEKHDPFQIVGVLKPTGTPNDRALFVNIEGFFEMHEHGEQFDAIEEARQEDASDEAETDGAAHGEAGHVHGPDCNHGPDRSVSAILVVTSEGNQSLRQALPEWINDEMEGAQAAHPMQVIHSLFDNLIGDIQLVLVILASLVVIVAGIGMMVSIYNSMSERRHEIAVMRALGAKRRTVMQIILFESILLSLGGGFVGAFLGHGLTGILGPRIAEHTGVVIHPLHFQWTELILIPGLVILASIVGYLPAVVAYRTEVAESLGE